MKNVIIPATLDEAVADLNSIGALLTAREWHRAAIVATFVEPDLPPGPKDRPQMGDLTPRQFAALGIAGLRSSETVRHCVKAWKSTGRPRPLPGQTIDLPTDDYPPAHDKDRAIQYKAKAIAEKMSQDPEYAAKIIDRLPAETKATIARDVIAKDDTVAQSVVADRDAHLAITRAQNKRAEDAGTRTPKPKDDDEMLGLDFLLLQAARQHVEDFAKKLAALTQQHGELPRGVQAMILEDLDTMAAILRNIRGVATGEIDVHVTDAEIDALLQAGE